MSEIAPSIIKKAIPSKSFVLSEALSIKQVVPSTHLLIPYALEKSMQVSLRLKITSIKRFDMNEHLIKNATSTFIVKVASLINAQCGYRY